MQVINQEEVDTTKTAKIRDKLRQVTDDELEFLMQLTTSHLSLTVEEKARRHGIESPHITIIVTDAPLADMAGVVQPPVSEPN